jgi:hypothetical protein
LRRRLFTSRTQSEDHEQGTEQNPGVLTCPHLDSSSSFNNLRELQW